MSNVLIVAEHLDGKLNPSTAKCVSAAKALNPAAIDIVVLAADMKIIAYDPYVQPARAAQIGVRLVPLDELMARWSQARSRHDEFAVSEEL